VVLLNVYTDLSMGQDQKKQATPPLGQELLSLAGIFIAAFLLLCLLSYRFPELSLAAAIQDSAGNWGGRVGNFVAQVLMSFLGLSSFWLIILLSFSSFQLFSPRYPLGQVPYVILGYTGIIIASSGLLGTFEIQTSTLFGKTYPVGGYLGELLSVLLRTYFGGPGAVLILFSLFLASLMVSVRLSPYCCGLKLQEAWQWLKEFHRRQREEPALRLEVVAREPRQLKFEERIKKEVNHTPNVHEPVRLIPSGEEQFQPLPVTVGDYRLPPLSLLDKSEHREVAVDKEHYFAVSKQLEEKLRDFGVEGKVEGISPGPVITTYEFAPAPGVKINKVVSLADDLALGLKAESVRIVGSIPGKAALGIEIPNPARQVVHIRDILANEHFLKSSSKLSLGLGMDVVGNPVVADLARMPHLLIAGSTGSGKSVAINAIICSILLKATPEEVRLLMVDPKRIELSGYEDIPHLLHPVVVDPALAARALHWAVREMERRYQLMEVQRVKSFASYNEVAENKLPLVVIIIDELADLMMVCSRDVEDAVARLAQMARAAGMHLILATQRPSVDVLTGLIKANFPTRISFKVASKIDSRTILDTSGAEHLLGAGDMLYSPTGSAKLQRIHGAYISEKETERIVTFLKEQGTARYDESVLQEVESQEDGNSDNEEYDEKYDEAVALVCETNQASISMVQRRLRVGYNRAARMIEIMEKEGIVGPSDGSKPREVLARKSY
jgi:DNA segregation ATPase FtsK/SpoIIIE, S-DNA-T family